MGSPIPVSPWPGYPEIPIFLDIRTDYPIPKSQRSTVTTFDTSCTSKSTSPVSPIEAPSSITVTPPRSQATQTLQIPSSEKSGQSSQQQSERSPVRHLSPVEYPSVNKLSESWTTRSHKTRSPNFSSRTGRGPSAASHFRFGDMTSPHRHGYTPLTSTAGSTPAGLGLMNTPTEKPPPVPEKPQKAAGPANIAERIEDRLWQYSIHGNVFKKWILEIISWSISALCMGGIIIVALYLKDRPLSRWPFTKTGITLNAYIATLARISSAALLLPVSEAIGQLKWSWFFQGTSKKVWDFEIFDNASRGPWGSLQLLMRTKGRKLAALGAAIVLLALALDPFFQQIASYPSRLTLLKEKGYVSYIRYYAPNYNKLFRGGYDLAVSDGTLSRITSQFFYANGTRTLSLGNRTRPEVSVQCPSGDCAWEPYQTLGFCSACEDVSNLLTFNCTTTKVDWIRTTNGTGAVTEYPTAAVCGYFLNSTSENPLMVSGYILPNQTLEEEVLLMRTLPLVGQVEELNLYGGSIHFKDIRNLILDAIIVGAANGIDSVYGNTAPIAHECMLTWCVKTIQSAFEEGGYRETVVDTFINKTAGPSPWLSIEVETAIGPATYIEYQQNITLDNSATGGNISGFGATNETASATILLFDDMFPSFYTKSKSIPRPLLRDQLYTGAEPLTRFLTDDMNPWMYPNHVPNHMERFATAMTNGIRASRLQEMFPGIAYLKETYVEIQFAWLALPVGLLLFSAVFLVVTVIRTSRENGHVGVWKTSAVATLLYGFPDDVQKKIASSKPEGTPRAKAKEMKVKLHPGTGWRVSGNLLSPLAPKFKRSQPPPGWI